MFRAGKITGRLIFGGAAIEPVFFVVATALCRREKRFACKQCLLSRQSGDRCNSVYDRPENRRVVKTSADPRSSLRSRPRTFVFHLLIANRYGIFRDELYYLPVPTFGRGLRDAR